MAALGPGWACVVRAMVRGERNGGPPVVVAVGRGHALARHLDPAVAGNRCSRQVALVSATSVVPVAWAAHGQGQ